MKKKIFIGVGLLAVGALGYLVLKNKKKKEESQEQLIEAEGEADFDFENADGKGLSSIINRPKKIIKVKDYQALIKKGSLTELNKYLVGKNIYTLQNNVNLRSRPSVNNGLINNNLLTFKNKGVYIGKVQNVVRGDDGKNIWFSISKNSYNSIIMPKLFEKFGFENKYVNVFVRADVVVVDLY
jgi:hypothetical protein